MDKQARGCKKGSQTIPSKSKILQHILAAWVDKVMTLMIRRTKFGLSMGISTKQTVNSTMSSISGELVSKVSFWVGAPHLTLMSKEHAAKELLLASMFRLPKSSCRETPR